MIITFISCNENSKGIYYVDLKQEFNVLLNDSNFKFNYLDLTITNTSFFLLQKKIIWKGEYSESDGSKTVTENITGVFENSEKLFLHPPRFGPFELLEAFPFPLVELPLLSGKKWQNSINVVSGHKDLNGKVVNAVYEVEELEMVMDSIKTWKITAASEIEGDNRNFEAVFLFNEAFGFTDFNYSLNGLPFAHIKLKEE